MFGPYPPHVVYIYASRVPSARPEQMSIP